MSTDGRTVAKGYNSGKIRSSITSIKYYNLQIMGTITEKFHQHPLKTIGGCAETRLCLRTDGQIHYYSPLRLTSGDKNIILGVTYFDLFYLRKEKQKVREKSRECHNHKPQSFPDPKRKRKPRNLNKHKPNKRTKSTKISLFPKRGNRNTKRTEKHKNKMTHGKTCNKSPYKHKQPQQKPYWE